MKILGGGWPITAFSNKESFARQTVSGFADAARGSGSDVVALHPGNADNRMIRKDGDTRYIERANLALIQSHGSTNGPNLNYEPPLVSWSPYAWGDEGILQWVLVGGCEALAFARNPAGQIALVAQGWEWNDVSPNRWADAFAGIAGICGYRSDSWYVPGFVEALAPWTRDAATISGLGNQYGARMYASLLGGSTFFNGWVSAADYLHRALGIQADVAVYCSHTANLSDTMTAFEAERRAGLSVGSITNRIVGSGPAPSYGQFSPNVDADGQPIGTRPTPLDLKALLAADLPQPATLPVFAYDVNSDEPQGSEQRAHEEGLAVDRGAVPGDFVISGFEDTAHLRSTSERLGVTVGRSLLEGAVLEVAAARGGQRVLTTENVALPVLFDQGLGALAEDDHLRGSSLQLRRKHAAREMPTTSEALRRLLEHVPTGADLRVHDLSPAYAKTGDGDRGELVPCVRIAFEIVDRDARQTYVAVI